MTRNQALGALLLSILLVTAGLVWRFDDYGLYAGGGMIALWISIAYDFEKKGGNVDG